MKQALRLPSEITPEWIAEEHPRLLAGVKDGELRLDFSQVRDLDSLAVAWLADLHRSRENAGGRLILSKVSPQLRPRLEKALEKGEAGTPPQAESLAVSIGGGLYSVFDEIKTMAVLLSESLYWSTLGAFKRKTILRGDTVIQMVRLGSSALPIVALLSFLIGFTLALQSGIQLQRFGATIFLASGIGISMVTEIGPVLTAVVLAGRSGSSITAELSTMVVQEEIGALQTMAINPIQFLVLPRFWAMTLCLPLLTVCSALMGIAAGLAVGMSFFNLSPASFLTELQSAITVNYVFQMLTKAVTFAWIITFVAVTKGIRVHGGADAVGKATTSCVVTCIFAIILADALFSFVFYM